MDIRTPSVISIAVYVRARVGFLCSSTSDRDWSEDGGAEIQLFSSPPNRKYYTLPGGWVIDQIPPNLVAVRHQHGEMRHKF